MSQLELLRSGPGLRRVPGLSITFRADVPSSPERLGLATDLGEAFIAARGGRCRVVVNANRRRVLSWRSTTAGFELSVHHLVLDAPREVMAIVLQQDPAAWDLLRGRFQERRLPTHAPPPTLNPRGDVHDLMELFHRVNREQFAGELAPVNLGWGEWPRVRPRRGLRLGSCGGHPPAVRIHPCLDHAEVPAWFVEMILFHELLHIVIPPTAAGTRRSIHPPELRRREREHPRYDEAQAWEKANIHAMLRRCAARLGRR